MATGAKKVTASAVVTVGVAESSGYAWKLAGGIVFARRFGRDVFAAGSEMPFRIREVVVPRFTRYEDEREFLLARRCHFYLRTWWGHPGSMNQVILSRIAVIHNRQTGHSHVRMGRFNKQYKSWLWKKKPATAVIVRGVRGFLEAMENDQLVRWIRNISRPS